MTIRWARIVTFAIVFRRLLRRGPRSATAVLSLEREEEEAEIAKAQREAQRGSDRHAESLLEKAAHRSYPFLRDPFE